MKRQKYDLIFSIGAACSCAQGLRDAELQVFSYPMDWLFGSDFAGRVDIVCNRFKRFIDISDLEYVFSERSIKCDAYHNKFNDLTFNHYFPTGVPLSESYDMVAQKYDRRISRLLEQIEKSERILLVYLEIPETTEQTSDKQIIKCANKLRKVYSNCKIDILYITYKPEMARGIIEENVLDNGVLRLYGNYRNKNPETPSYAVDTRFVRDMLRKYAKLKQPLYKIIRKRLLRFIIQFIPNHNVRVNLRKKWHLN